MITKVVQKIIHYLSTFWKNLNNYFFYKSLADICIITICNVLLVLFMQIIYQLIFKRKMDLFRKDNFQKFFDKN